MRDGRKEKELSYEELFSDYNFLTPVYEPMIDDTIAGGQKATENSGVTDEFKSRLENVSNAVMKLYKCLRKEAMGKLPKMAHALIQKVVPVLTVRVRARSYRCHRKTAVASNSSQDDDGGSDSSDPEPPTKPYHTLLNPPKEQPNSLTLVVTFPRQMLCGLFAVRWAT